MRTTDTRIVELSKGNKKGLKESNQTPSTELINNKIPKYYQIPKKLLIKLISTTTFLTNEFENKKKYYLAYFNVDEEMHKIRLTKNEYHYIIIFIKTHSKEILNIPEE